MERTDVEFGAADGAVLRGWIYLPDNERPAAAISMAHGFGAVKEHGLDRFARAFADHGFVVLVHDHRGFGASEGLPRNDVDPWRQVEDWRVALTFLERHPRVNPRRIGIWGTSYAGGHVLVLGATDPRVSCVVSQVPTVSGYAQGQRRVAPDRTGALESQFVEDDRRVAAGEEPATIQLVAAPGAEAAYTTAEARAFYKMPSAASVWSNEVTLRSVRASRMYEPGVWARRVSPTPLAFIIARNDTVTLTDLELETYASSLEPSTVTLIPGGHFAPYDAELGAARSAALAWFTRHLLD